MNKFKNTIPVILFGLSHLSFSVGIDKINFYEEIESSNINNTYIDFYKDSNSDNYNFILGEGLLDYENGWRSEYSVKKKYEKNIESSEANQEDAHGWETDLSLYKELRPLKVKGKELYNDIGIVYYYDQLDQTGATTVKSERHEFKARYRIRMSSNLGKGGSYSGIDIYSGVVNSTQKDGSIHGIDFINITNLGYGFQNITQQSNEILDYNNYDSTYKPSIENTFRWTYELNENWAFSPELYANLEKYTGGSSENYDIEFSIIPYLLYSNQLKEDLYIFSKIGLIGYGMEEYKTSGVTYNDKGVYLKLIAGITYVW